MNVHPNIADHPKFIVFKLALEHDAALEYLTRIWGHCQERHKGENWGPVSDRYVEMIARWSGRPGALYAALAAPFEGKAGWVHRNDKNELIVTGWEEHNMALRRAWENGARGGRPTKRPAQHNPPDNPRVTPTVSGGIATGLATDNPSGSPRDTRTGLDVIGEDRTGEGARARGISGDEPTLEQIKAAAAEIRVDGQPVPEAYAEHFFCKKREKISWWLNPADGEPLNWIQQLENWWKKDRALPEWCSTGNKNGGDIRDLESELFTETDPARRRQLRAEIKRRQEVAA